MDIVFQIRGKAVVRGADYCPTSTETEEMIRQMFMGEGIDIDVQVSDMYELTEIIETEDEPQTEEWYTYQDEQEYRDRWEDEPQTERSER